MIWTKIVKTITILFSAVAILASFIGAIIASSEIEGFGGFLAFIGILFAGVLVIAVFMPLVMMFVEVAESIFSIEDKMRKLDYKSDMEDISNPSNKQHSADKNIKKYCVKCGKPFSGDGDYCASCSNALDNKVVEQFSENLKDRIPNENEHLCPNCGNIQSKSINRCLKCGQLISKKI
ncbi:hypothetical protein [uncultured Eubacterium sp.]|uniref:hypothetical protein n=1 Tax=uncultured Eubacterium sp. TaxID=165185 RepID=UPI0025FCA424|nr:hypothetical protein [uncultured Eubacterium sp.]